MNTNAKVKESKGYEYWATKHNLNTMVESVVFIREHGINSIKQLDAYIRKSAEERQSLQDKIKEIDKDMQLLFDTMEQVHTVKKYRAYYKEYKSNPSDKAFFEEHKSETTRYETDLAKLKKSYSKLPDSKDILDKLDKLQEKKEYSNARVFFYKIYYGRALSNTKELWNLHGQGNGEVALSLYSSLSKVKSPIVFLLVQ